MIPLNSSVTYNLGGFKLERALLCKEIGEFLYNFNLKSTNIEAM